MRDHWKFEKTSTSVLLTIQKHLIKFKHLKMIECLSEIGINDKDLQKIAKQYWEQTATVKLKLAQQRNFK